MEYTFRKTATRVLLVVAAFAFVATMAWAQAGAGGLTGVVTDPQGAVVANVPVTLTNSSTGDKRSANTGSAGTYSFTALPIVGSYTLELAPSGFRSVKIDKIVISVASTTTQDVKLELGSSNEQVTVEAGAQSIQTSESAVSQLIDRRVWESMPLETRSQNEFINLVAGAVPQIFNDTGRGASVNGTRSGTGNYLVEGADNNEQGQGGVALLGAGGANTTISPDAIQEYRVITNDFPAEYGKAGGFVTDTVMKSGVNQFHGSAFEYNRIQALAANDYFSNQAQQRDHLVRNQFGGSLGGPIIKDKMFFYGTGEIHRLRQSSPTTTTGTTQDFLNFVNSGQFEQYIESDPNGYCNLALGGSCPGAFSHSATLGPIFQQLLAAEPGAFPLATATENCNPAAGPDNNPTGCLAQGAYTGTFVGAIVDSQGNPVSMVYPVQVYGTVTKPVVTATDQSRFSVKYDYKVTERNQLNFVYLFDDVQTEDNNGAAASGLIGVGESIPSRAQNAAITWNRTLSNTILNQARFGYLRRVANFTAPGTEGVPNIATFLDPLGVSFGSTAGIPQFFTENQFQIKDDLSITKSKHNFKTGGEYRRTRNGSSFFNDRNGTTDPWSVEDLVTDLTFDDEADQVTFGGPVVGGCAFCSASIDPGTGNLPVYYRGYRANEMAFYGQDDWRVRPTLTLNLGVRWEYFGPPHNFLPNTDSNFYFGAADPIAPTSNPFFPATVPYYEKVASGTFQVRDQLWNKDKNNFGPRIGFAWDTFGNAKVVVRGGFAIAYDRIYNNLFENIRFNPPFFSDATFGFFGNSVAAGGLSTPGFYAVPFTANQTGFLLDPAIFPNGLPKASPRHMDQDLVSPYYEQFHFGLQTELARGLVLETNFIGTLGKKLTGIINNNTFDGRLACSAPPYDPGTPCADAGFADGFSTRRPNNTIGSDNFRTNAFSSNYYGWQTNLRKSYSMGLQFNASYTFSKATDEISDAFRPKTTGGAAIQPVDSSNVHLDYGPADFDVRNRIVFSYNYDLPFLKTNRWLGGWQVNGVFSWQTGVPIPIWDPNNDLNGDGVLNDRPVYASGFNASNVSTGKNPADGFLNPDAFESTVCPASENAGIWCNSPMHRNDVYGPHFINLDFGVGKAFKITETAKITLLANFFNIFNHPNMDTPTGNFGDASNFGKSLNTLGDNGLGDGHRTTQLALRFDF